jgi:predicted DNA-binding protein (UPF0251 family)
MVSEEPTPAERFGPDQQMPAEEKVFALSEIGVLTERQAEAYVYRRVEKLDRQDAAAEMGVAASTVDDYERDAADKLTDAEETIDRLFELGWWQGPLTIVYGFGTDDARERFVNEIIASAPDAEVFVMCDYRMAIRDTLARMFDDAVAGRLDIAKIQADLPEGWLAEQMDGDEEYTVPYENVARIIEEHSDLIAAAHLGPIIDPGGPQRDEAVTSEEPPISGGAMNELSRAFVEFVNNRIQQPKRGVLLARGDSILVTHIAEIISSQLRLDKYDESRSDVEPHPLARMFSHVTHLGNEGEKDG